MGDRRRTLGAAGESLTASWYRDAGYEVLDRNWRCSDGELDLVLRRDGVIVFCEVKTRRSDAFGAPFEAVTATKQRRLRVLATRWLDEHRPRRTGIRFDVASVDARRGYRPIVDVIENVF